MMTRPTVRLAGAALLAALASTPLAASAETVKLTILGVGDIYDFAGDKNRGGFARMNAVAKAERAANPNFLYVMDGDMLSPSILSGFDKGQNTIDLTNLVPFDIAVPGNHEFDFGPENFAEKMAAEVKEAGVARVLEPMSSADRKIIHDTLSGIDGIATRSEGDDPYRRVIITPAND